MRASAWLRIAALGLGACGGGGGGPGGDNHPPTAAIQVGDTVAVGEPLVFAAAASSDPDGDALLFSWDFGDGKRGGSEKLAHLFSAAGMYSVRLRVSDGRGGTAETTHVVSVTDIAPPASFRPATVQVRDVARQPIAGADVRVVGGATATTGSDGVAVIDVGEQTRQTLRVARAGYTEQSVVVKIEGAGDPWLEVILGAIEDAVVLPSAEAGGTVEGKDGVRLTLPPGAVIDETGAPVAGAIDVRMTPIDVVHSPEAFPGKFEGVATSGMRAPIVSFGTVDVVLSQGGRRLDLAPARAATLEIPVYPTLDAGGERLAPGGIVPLWTLDEDQGVWVQEGTGTLVASAAPGGLSLRATVGHFSWYNCDAFLGATYTQQTDCCIDSNFDGECDGPIICFVRGRTDCAGSICGSSKPTSEPAPADDDVPPQYEVDAIIGAGIPVPLVMSSRWPMKMEAWGENGLRHGTAIATGAQGSTTQMTLVLGEAEEPTTGGPIVAPWDQTYASGGVGSITRFTFDSPGLQALVVRVDRATGSELAGTFTLRGPAMGDPRCGRAGEGSRRRRARPAPWRRPPLRA